MPSPLRIGYLLEDTDLSGGVRVQLAQADALIARGHQVTMFTKGMPLHWRRSRAEWEHIDDFSQVNAGELDFLIGGFWTTVEPAYRLAGERAIHLCQGYEATFTAYQSIRPQIEATYQLPVPKITVSRHLVPLLEKHGFKAVWVGQIVDAEFYRPAIPAENEPLRVLLAGASQVDVKGISDGYGAVTHARSYGATFDLIRVSPWAPARDEPVEELVQEFHAGLNTENMVRLIQSCDVFLGPNRAEEGFGLPAAESLASGLPAVLTRIPSYLSWAETLDFALFAEEGDAEALGDQLLEMIQNEDLRAELRSRGREVAEQFRAENAADRLENFLLARRAGLAQNRPTERETPVGDS